MTFPVVFLAFGALVTLVLGFQSWRLTSSGKVRLNAMIGTAIMAYAASLARNPDSMLKASGAAFIVAMLYGGYAIGLFLRKQTAPELRLAARLMIAVSLTALAGAIIVFPRG